MLARSSSGNVVFAGGLDALFLFAGAALSAKFVLLDLKGELAFGVARYAAARDQVQEALFIQLRRPTDGNFEPRAHRQIVVRGKQDARAADVERFAVSGHDFGALIERFIAKLALDRKAARFATFRCSHFRCTQSNGISRHVRQKLRSISLHNGATTI